MPRVSQNHDGSPKRRLQPIRILDEPLGIAMHMEHVHVYRTYKYMYYEQ